MIEKLQELWMWEVNTEQLVLPSELPCTWVDSVLWWKIIIPIVFALLTLAITRIIKKKDLL